MIRTNGYYIDSPKYYEEIIFGGHIRKGFHYNAYKFNDNGTFFTMSKYSNVLLDTFCIDDFDRTRLNKFCLEKNKIKLTFDFGKDWQNDFEIIFYSEKVLCEQDRVLRFHNWK